MTDADGETFRLIYRSRDRIDPDRRRAELGTLFTEARSKNKAAGITGALLVSGDCFVQTLEGREPAVREVFDRIQVDRRHDTVAVIETGTVAQRVFPRWSMARVERDDEPDTFLIAHQDGIAPATRRDASPEQDAILDLMRRAAAETRADAQADSAR